MHRIIEQNLNIRLVVMDRLLIRNYFLRKTGADVVGIGEGEITFVELLDAFAGKRTLESVDGIAYLDKTGGGI